jgi:hypothetical protein
MAEGKIRVGPAAQEFPAAALVSMVVGATSEWDRWSGHLNVGIVVRTGNTDQRDYNAMLFLRREAGRTRIDLSGANNYGTLNGDKNINNQQASGRFDVFLTKRLYVVPIAASVYADEFQNIDLRTTVSAGFGYDLVDESKWNWTLGLSAGYLGTRYISVQPGEDDLQESGTVIPSTFIEWDPNGDIDTQLDHGQGRVSQSGRSRQHGADESPRPRLFDRLGPCRNAAAGGRWDAPQARRRPHDVRVGHRVLRPVESVGQPVAAAAFHYEAMSGSSCHPAYERRPIPCICYPARIAGSLSLPHRTKRQGFATKRLEGT